MDTFSAMVMLAMEFDRKAIDSEDFCLALQDLLGDTTEEDAERTMQKLKRLLLLPENDLS